MTAADRLVRPAPAASFSEWL